MLDFSILLLKDLYPFLLAVSWLNFDLYVVFYVGFRNLRKTNTDNQSVTCKIWQSTQVNLFYS